VYVLQGYTGHLVTWRNRTPFRQPFPEVADSQIADSQIADGEIPPCIVVYVDAWTAIGGSQFVDSPGTGRYHSYLCDEVVPFVDARYRTLAAPKHRGVSGKSSGGFGAFITPMLRPDLFGGLASHAGDSLYEYCYISVFTTTRRSTTATRPVSSTSPSVCRRRHHRDQPRDPDRCGEGNQPLTYHLPRAVDLQGSVVIGTRWAS
jgi:Putative esterase